MSNDLSFTGLFWLPNNEDGKIPGTLTFDQAKGTILTLLGGFQEFGNAEHFQPVIINGFTSSGKKLTLYKCFELNRSFSAPGMATSKIKCRFLFVGATFNNESDIVFNKLCVKLKNLDEWIGISGLEFNKNFIDKPYVIKYTIPDTINFTIPGFKASFNFNPEYPSISIYNKKLSIGQRVQFVIETKEGENDSFDNFSKKMFAFQMFLTIATHSPSFPEEIIYYSSSLNTEYEGKTVFPDEIRLYYINTIKQTADEFDYLDILFRYSDITENFGHIIKTWYENQENLVSILGLFLQDYFKPGPFDENRFINIARALEIFHRKFFSNEVLSKDDQKERLKDICNNVPEKHQNWLKQKLAFSNEPSLKERIEELLRIFNNNVLKKIIKEENIFFNNIRDNRNYYTHYNPDLQNKVLKGGELYYLTERMKVLLTCCILEKMNIDKNIVEKILERYDYRLVYHLM